MTIDCSKCPERGSCCGPFQMDKTLTEKFKDKFQTNNFKRFDLGTKELILCEDFGCIFLNRTTKTCEIYEDRPEICRLYGRELDWRIACPYFKENGVKRSEAKTKQIQRKHKHLIDILSRKKL